MVSLEGVSVVDYGVWIVAAATAAAVLYSMRQAVSPSKNGVPLPPGPPAHWFWDNVMPTSNIARTLTDWIAEYGPVITLCQGSNITVVIGRMDAATDIMEKEGQALVDRPIAIAAREIFSNGMRIVLEPSGERFRRMRKAVHTHLQPRAAESYQDIQFENAKNVITDLLNDPKNHQAHAKRYAASVILRVTYGKSTPTSVNDPEVIRVHRAISHFQEAAQPGAFLVDRIPWLKYVPGYGRRLKEYYKYDLQLYSGQLKRVETEMVSNKGGPSFGRTLLEHTNDHGLSWDEMSFLAGGLFAAGSDTTAAGITTLIMAAACHPEAQVRVQEELDMVVGTDRVPTFQDSTSLPQLHAFISEALRWRPISRLGFSHRATRDVIWRGQCIPAGATVLGCHWAISRDPEAFPEPEKFDPQRWLDKDGRLRNDMHFYTYGFGRRVCPGQHVANRSLYINLALILWAFRIAERPGAPIDTNAFLGELVAHATPFEVEFTPRIDEKRLRVMMEIQDIPL